MLKAIPYLLLLLLFASCSVFKRSPKFGLSEGFYKTNVLKGKTTRVYVEPGEDSLKIYQVGKTGDVSTNLADSTIWYFTKDQYSVRNPDFHFRQNSFDIDVLTIPFKYRPAISDFPNQLNASFNGAIFLGYRSDIYSIHYSRTPTGKIKRNITHYGYSLGLFSGIGSARIDEYVTNNRVNIQYDGVVNLSGFNAVFGVENVSVGLAVGVDHLLDKNHKVWASQGKLWFGLSFGLNLN